MKSDRPSFLLLLVILALVFSGCAVAAKGPLQSKETAYVVGSGDGLYDAYSPVFVVDKHEELYNRIGTPRARPGKRGGQEVFVDPAEPVIYTEKRIFTTENGVYANLIFRVHFQETPLSIFPFYLSTGKNIGLFVIVTLNDKGEPLLFTTVHTCGCYLAFIPTTYLSEKAFPKGWDKSGQKVFRERLPGFLSYPPIFSPEIKAVVSLRSGTHRVRDITLERDEGLGQRYVLLRSKRRSIEGLNRVAIEGGGSTSFFETGGARHGYVKESQKPWERLLMSWWALDWRVGEDKALGKDKNDARVFYTSLKFWRRDSSDMRDFRAFLEDWGWGL